MKNESMIEKILEFFRRRQGVHKLSDISKSLGIKSDTNEYTELKKVLRDLCQQQVLEKSTRRRYKLHEFDNSGTIEGILSIRRDSGIVESNMPGLSKVVIKRRGLGTALDGDKVLVNLYASKKGRKQRGEIIDVLERNQEKICGTLDYDGNFYFLVPDDEKYYVDFLIPKNKLNNAGEGDKVAASLMYWNDHTKSPKAEIIEIIGTAGDPTAEYDSLVKDLNLPESFQAKVEAEADAVPIKITAKDIKGRLDLRKADIITIDPVDAKDFDDALSLEELPNGNLLLGVHIADVSHYVPENSEIDIEARLRGTSVYLADRVIPMLPEKLSNNVCSLVPKKDRLAFSVMMEFSKRGALKDYKISESVIKSKRRFNYGEVQEIIEGAKGDYSKLVFELNQLATTLRKKRFTFGGIDFDTFEIRYTLDENKYPVEANLKTSTDATILVEEFMLAANKVVAGHIKEMAKKHKKRKLPYLFRIHDKPDTKQLKDVLQFIGTFGPRINKKDVKSKDINRLLLDIKHGKEKYIINQLLIRSMAKAVYSTNNIGHYGLGFKDYTHFTSPIRRYPDLIIHRIIKEYDKTGTLKDSRVKFLNILLKDVAGSSSVSERLAVQAERESTRLTGAMMAKEHTGEEYSGIISGVTSFGLFVLMDGIYTEGLLHIKDMTDDYYFYDEKRFCLVGRRNKHVFRIGKRLKVQILNVNIDKRKIDLAYVGEEDE